MIRLSVTTIEAYRLYLNDVVEESDLIATIKKEYTESERMRIGTAFHDVVQNPGKRLDTTIEAYKSKNGYVFDRHSIDSFIQLIDYDNTLFEVKETKVYTLTNGAAIEVVGKADALSGIILTEFKTTASQFSYDKYYESCQWKFYLDIFKCKIARYMVAQLNSSGNQLLDANIATFTAYDCESELLELLDGIYGFIINNNLINYVMGEK